MNLETLGKSSDYSNLLNLATFKIEIFAYRVEITYGLILFLESLILDEFTNKIWSHGISTL
jgi:hypothetical protein